MVLQGWKICSLFTEPADVSSLGCQYTGSPPSLLALAGLTSLTGSELNLYLQVTEEMKREEPAMARRLLQSASFKRRQSQAEAAAAAPTGPAPSSSATQPR